MSDDFPEWYGVNAYRHYRPSRRRDCAIRCAFVIAYSAVMLQLGILICLAMGGR